MMATNRRGINPNRFKNSIDCPDIRTDKALYAYALVIKNQFLRQSNPLSKY
jgi:hypothetical protein